MLKNKRYLFQRGFVAALVALSFLTFQNCGQGFEAVENGSFSQSSGGPQTPDDPGAPAPAPVPPPANPAVPLQIFVRDAITVQGGDLKFNVEMNRLNLTPVVVNVRAVAGTATAMMDFDNPTTNITIAAGQISTIARVPTLAFSIASVDKTLTLQAVSTSVGTVTRPMANGVIKATVTALKFKQIATGAYHTCGITMSDTVKCWGVTEGSNNNARAAQPLPYDINNLVGAKAISAGAFHTCAITAANTVKCWGSNVEGQLGNGTLVNSFLAPVDSLGLTGVKAIAAGGDHTCAIDGANKLFCWGSNLFAEAGQLLNVRQIPTPTEVPLAAGSKAITAGQFHVCLITATDTVKCFGNWDDGRFSQEPNLLTEIAGLINVTAVSAGGRHTCATLANNTVKCWGDDGSGQLGEGPTDQGAMGAASGLFDPLNLGTVKAISSNGAYTCVVTNIDTVKCWGGTVSAIGIPFGPVAAFTPQDIAGLTNVKSIHVGNYHACAITATATARCWGFSRYGQTGGAALDSVSLPLQEPDFVDAKMVSSSGGMACVITNAGLVKCRSRTGFPPIGVVPGVNGSKAISTASNTTCVITATDTVRCWGTNFDGQLGNGTTDFSTNPVDVLNVTGAKALALGSSHVCALVAGDTVKCWGSNTFGQLGNNSNLNSPLPTDVQNLVGVKNLVAGSNHTCAILQNENVKCWGYNFNGELGNGVVARTAVPVDVLNVAGVKALALGQNHTCAIVANNTVKCWGRNVRGQLGNGTVVNSLTPVDVLNVSGAIEISASHSELGFSDEFQSSTCARLMSGEIKCWGANANGSIKNGSQTPISTPIDVAITNASSISLSIDGLFSITDGNRVTRYGRKALFGQPAENVVVGPEVNSIVP